MMHPHQQQPSTVHQQMGPPQPGLNGAMPANNAAVGGGNLVHPRSSDGESDHEYYNDVDRLKREMQPLHQPRNETTG